MLYSEVVAVSCENHTEHTLGKMSLNGRPGGTGTSC
jgi:hypothetical protein